MNSTSAQFVTTRRIGVYEPIPQISTWGENFKSNGNLNSSSSLILEDTKLDNQSEDASHGTMAPSNQYDQTRSSHYKHAHTKDSIGIIAFEMEYGHWVEEQNKQIGDLRTALNAHISDVELRMLVDNGLEHYTKFFRMKGSAASADVFYVMSGMWKTSAERFFSWIGGFRPSDLLKVLLPQLDPMTEQQLMEVYNLQQSCQQADDALTQGMEKLQQTLADTVAAGLLVEHVASAMEKLESLVGFVNQADHLRPEALQQMYRILTVRQAARGLLALGEYFQRLRALSSLWATRPHKK
ncbi:transcription factor tga1, partial [Quercus suber]